MYLLVGIAMHAVSSRIGCQCIRYWGMSGCGRKALSRCCCAMFAQLARCPSYSSIVSDDDHPLIECPHAENDSFNGDPISLIYNEAAMKLLDMNCSESNML
jgi:hypothetical protein